MSDLELIQDFRDEKRAQNILKLDKAEKKLKKINEALRGVCALKSLVSRSVVNRSGRNFRLFFLLIESKNRKHH